MSLNKRTLAISPMAETRDVIALKNKTGNLYESIVVTARRANQISVKMKEELQRKLEEYSMHITDNMEEVQENKEQTELSRMFERLPNAALQATSEFMNDEIYYRKKDQ